MDKTLITLSLKFIRKLFISDDNFAIFITDQNFSAKGYIIDEPSNLLDVPLELKGYFEKSDKYGDTFVFTSYNFKAYNYYFLTHMVKGINEKIATEMIDKFGDNLYDIIENMPEKLLIIKGIGKKKLAQILTSYQQMSYIKKLAEFLLPFDISNHLILIIYNHFKEEAIKLVEQDPYQLTQIKGIAFKKADSIAIKIGKSPDDISRIQSGILYTFNQYANMQGSSCLDEALLFEESQSVLNVSPFELGIGLFRQALQSLIDDEKVVVIARDDETSYITKELFEMENYIIKTIKNAPMPKESILDDDQLELFIDELQNQMGISLSKEQKKAVSLANDRYPIFSICGYAGTGKSTVSKIILQLMSKIYPLEFITCCSLSGVASNRIKQLTAFASSTIHALLKFKNGQFEYNEKNKLPYKVILLDEASMVNISIFYALIQAIDFEQKAILILVGDIAQLPPIGAGDIYAHLIEYKLTPFVILEQIYRQKNQVIKLFASHIRQGEVPPDYTEPYEDFLFLATSSHPDSHADKNEQILQKILEIATVYQDMRYLYNKKDIQRYISYFQVISPIKSNLLGTKNLNQKLQQILNPNSQKSLDILSYHFRVKDKVIHLKNKNMPIFSPDEFKSLDMTSLDNRQITPEKRIFNGQIGVITHIDVEKSWLFVYYPIEEEIIWYKKEHIKEHILDLAYAMSGHKTQGSEFENVLIPITLSHFMMLHTRLVYTMITRVKNKLILVGESVAFENACKKLESKKRESLITKTITL